MSKIYIIGIGPGDPKYMTPQALNAIETSNIIVGYDVYVELIKPLTEGKTVVSTGMKKEVERCQKAVSFAKDGDTVSLVCSGDAGVYGMAGILFEVAKDEPDIEIVVVPGITAACSAAAVLGAPLIHDFAVISLSDLLTPWEKIEKRLRLASDADFVICIYNPVSQKRHDYLKRACEIMMTHKSGDTWCGFVKNIGREGEVSTICTLENLGEQEVDMFTTVVVGNSQTKVINGRLVTPRGYRL